MRSQQPAAVPPVHRPPAGLYAHFGRGHQLAGVAARHCAAHGTVSRTGAACGPCWERAIRDDEKVAVEFGLHREVSADPNYVDEIAVELACRGERVELTPAEFTVAVARLRGRDLPPTRIAQRLRVHTSRVTGTARTDLNGAAA